MRVGIISISHESNTFIAGTTTLEDFRQKYLLTGEQIIARFKGGHHEISGFIEALEQNRIEVVPIFAAGATPGGTISSETYDALLHMMLDLLKQADRLDGLLVATHGAAVCESHPDMDGDWLSRVREFVGNEIPIIGTLDPHANISQKMIDASDALIAYRTNPHLDQKARGIEAGNLLSRTLRGEIHPTQAASFPPVSINIERQLTAASPCNELVALADEILKRPNVLSDSVILGFPYADVPKMGSGFIVVTDDHRALAQKYADELASYLIEHRHEFVGELIDVDRAIDLALKSPAPVCLLDMGDNVGGGAPGDSTILARALHQRQIEGSFVSMFDPHAVQQAITAGVGGKFAAQIGGKTDDRHGPPLSAIVTVVSVHDGRFKEPLARHGGMSQYEMGPTVIVRTEHGMLIQLMSRRTPPFSLGQLTSCGIDPSCLRIIVAKGVHAPVAAYSPVCKTMIRVNTPGVTTADMTSFQFKKRRRPMFPFEEI